MLVGSFELIKPFNNVLFDNKETIEHLYRLSGMVLSPFVDIRDVNYQPIMLECIHSDISKDH